MDPPLTSKVLRVPNLKRGQENIRIQDRVSDDYIKKCKIKKIFLNKTNRIPKNPWKRDLKFTVE